MNGIKKGIWPTMITPYDREGRVDLNAAKRIVDWYARRNCDGIFAVCQSSEMFNLSLEERVALARTVVEAAQGRLEVIASGHISDDPQAQVEELGAIAETGVKAVVMVSNRLAREDEDDEVWIRNAQRILDALPGVTFGVYECPYPYKRLMTERTLGWCARSGRFAFLKDTCCDARMIRERIQVIRREAAAAGVEPLGLYNANTMTLLETLRDGASGFSGVMGNLHPELYVWLDQNWREQPEKAEEASGAADAAQQSGGAGISHLRQASHGGRGRGNDADRPQSARRPVRICPAGNTAAGGNCGKSRPQALRH